MRSSGRAAPDHVTARSFADGAVDALADQVRVSVVAGVLLEHVQVHPPQADTAPPPRLAERAEYADKRRWRSAETKTSQNGNAR
jgi:hypothetical protein